MSKLLEQLYFKSPVAMQNIAVSAYGFRLHGRRYGGISDEYLSRLRKSQSFSPDDMGRLQMEQLRNLLEHAFETVPYYKEFSARAGLSIGDFSDASDLRHLPIQEKEHLRNDPDSYKSEIYPAEGKLFELNTSGTSGKPLTIYCDIHSRRRHYAFWRRLREWFGIKPGMLRATFFGRIAVSPEQRRPPYWRYDAFQRNYLFSSYHMSDLNLRHYYEKLLEIQAEELIGYPSSLFVLAKYMKKNSLHGILPRAVFTTAETLLEHQRAIIEEVFERDVVDQYGCTEMALFVSQCEKGTHHVHPEHGIVEIVDEDGIPLPAGEEGEAVCTGFANYAMPMIRYKLGDRLALSKEQCSCGRSFPVVRQIIGRVDDILVTPDGRSLGRLDPVFKGMSGIYETQIIQPAPDRLVLKMVTDPAFTERNREDLIYEIRKRTGSEMRIDIEIVDSIPKDENGKFRSVISAISNNSEKVSEIPRRMQQDIV